MKKYKLTIAFVILVSIIITLLVVVLYKEYKIKEITLERDNYREEYRIYRAMVYEYGKTLEQWSLWSSDYRDILDKLDKYDEILGDYNE